MWLFLESSSGIVHSDTWSLCQVSFQCMESSPNSYQKVLHLHTLKSYHLSWSIKEEIDFLYKVLPSLYHVCQWGVGVGVTFFIPWGIHPELKSWLLFGSALIFPLLCPILFPVIIFLSYLTVLLWWFSPLLLFQAKTNPKAGRFPHILPTRHPFLCPLEATDSPR